MKILKSLVNPIYQIEHEEVSFNLGFWKVIGAILVYEFINTVLIASYSAMFESSFLDNNYIFIIIIELISIPILSIVMLNTYGKQKWVTNTYKKTNKQMFFYLTLLIIAFRLLYDATLMPLVNLIPQGALLESVEGLINNNILYFILSAVVVAPIIEEIIFRGVVLGGLLNRYSPKKAIIISSLLFALMHMNIHQGINAFILGSLFGYIYYKTKSLYLTMFCHFVNNSFAFIGYMPETLTGFIINLAVSLAIAIPILLFLKKHLKFNYESNFISTLKNPETDVIYSSID
ncbi:MAG: lysostaphin resistance A-like protein [Clostridium sp.]